jgi:uncharacterized membrane protein
MMTRRIKSRALFAVAAALLAVGQPAAAQTAEAAGEEISREELEHFARAHVAINEIRDEFHGEVARVHDAEGRQRAREQVEEKISAVLEEHELTRERFDEITLLISLDSELRALFDEILVQLAEEGTA